MKHNDGSTKRYVLCPGFVQSMNDSDDHYIGPVALARLYGVNLDQCEIYEPERWWPMSFYLWAAERNRGLIRLEPREDGNYSLPKQERMIT